MKKILVAKRLFTQAGDIPTFYLIIPSGQMKKILVAKRLFTQAGDIPTFYLIIILD